MKKRYLQAVTKVWIVDNKEVRYLIAYKKLRGYANENGEVTRQDYEVTGFDYLATEENIKLKLDFDDVENCELDAEEHIVVDKEVPREELTIDTVLEYADKYRHYEVEYDVLLEDFNKLTDKYNKLLDDYNKVANEEEN